MVAVMEELIAELRGQRDLKLRHFEALDTKAGILLGFAGVIAALGPAAGALSIGGRAFAIAAALLALASFVPRRFPSVSPKLLSEVLDRPYPGQRQVALIDILVVILARADRVLAAKSRALVLALGAIFLSTGLLGAAIMQAGGPI
jgi:hypothetical protein